MAATLLLFNAGILFSLILVLWVGLRAPSLTRREIFFAVTVSADFPQSPEALDAYRGYRRWLWLHTGLALLLLVLGNVGFLLSNNPELGFLIFLVGSSLLSTTWQVGAMLWAFQHARRRVLPHAVPPSSIREASLVPSPAPRNPALSLLRLGPWLLLGLSALYLQSNWDKIPERFPIHWGLQGNADGWAHRSVPGVFGMLLMGALVVGFLELVMFLMTIGMPRPGTAATGSRSGAIAWLLQAMRWFMLGIEYHQALLFAVLGGYLPLHARGGPMSPFLLIFLFSSIGLLLVGCTIFLVWVIRRWTAMQRAEKAALANRPPTDVPQGDRTEDRYWRWGGLFYYNPNDPAMWVEKRFGIGWTANLAHPTARRILVLLLLLIPLFMLAMGWLASSMG